METVTGWVALICMALAGTVWIIGRVVTWARQGRASTSHIGVRTDIDMGFDPYDEIDH